MDRVIVLVISEETWSPLSSRNSVMQTIPARDSRAANELWPERRIAAKNRTDERDTSLCTAADVATDIPQTLWSP